jgi:hypothetical protein
MCPKLDLASEGREGGWSGRVLASGEVEKWKWLTGVGGYQALPKVTDPEHGLVMISRQRPGLILMPCQTDKVDVEAS